MTQQPDELDELLQPTVAPARARPLPWRVQSQFWVAFFGGVPAVTAIALLNARRLGSSARKQWLILLVGLAGVALFLAFLVLKDSSSKTLVRAAGRILAVAIFLVFAWIQRADDRHYQVFGAGDYASLWGPGIAAVIGSIVLLIAVGTAVVMWLR